MSNTALSVMERPDASLTKQEETTATLMRRATDVAGVCKQIVLKTAMQIQGRKYVRVEGWQSIATAHGCIPSARDVEKIEGGWRAIGELRRMSDGAVLAIAEGFVGTDETKTWGQRPEYACRAMAQTRAISRVCRSAFAHVVVLMDAGLETCPAEEMLEVETIPAQSPPPPQQTPPSRPTAPKQPIPVSTDKVERKPMSEPVTLGDVTRVEAKFTEYKEVNSKPDAPKPWKAFFCKFEDENGQSFEAGTFSATIGENLPPLQGQNVILNYKPGKKPGTFEIVSIEPSDFL